VALILFVFLAFEAYLHSSGAEYRFVERYRAAHLACGFGNHRHRYIRRGNACVACGRGRPRPYGIVWGINKNHLRVFSTECRAHNHALRNRVLRGESRRLQFTARQCAGEVARSPGRALRLKPAMPVMFVLNGFADSLRLKKSYRVAKYRGQSLVGACRLHPCLAPKNLFHCPRAPAGPEPTCSTASPIRSLQSRYL